LGVEMKDADKEGKLAKFWKQCETGTYKLLADHWAEADALARALLETGDLSGREVIDIIQGASGVKERIFEEYRLDEFVPVLPYQLPEGFGNGYAEMEAELAERASEAAPGD